MGRCPNFLRKAGPGALVSHIRPSVQPPHQPSWLCDTLDPHGVVSAVKVCGLLLEKAACLVLGLFCSSVPDPGLWGKLYGLDNTRYSVEDVALCLQSVFTAQRGGTFKKVYPPSHSLPTPLKTASSFQHQAKKSGDSFDHPFSTVSKPYRLSS